MLLVLKQGNFNIYKNLSKLPVKDIAKQQSKTAGFAGLLLKYAM